jgi:hypothetical protein
MACQKRELDCEGSIYGIPREDQGDWRDYFIEDLFHCWMCDEFRPWYFFSTFLSRTENLTYENLIERLDFGHYPCCDQCAYRMCVRHVPSFVNQERIKDYKIGTKIKLLVEIDNAGRPVFPLGDVLRGNDSESVP